MLHRSRFLIAALLVVMTSAMVSYAVSASMPNALLAAGSTRYAIASSVNQASLHVFDGWEDMPGMTKYITIPAGKTADVMVIFCGDMDVLNVGDWINIQVLVRDALAAPSPYSLYVSELPASQCAVFYKTGVTAGTPAVKVQWEVSGIPSTEIGFMNSRSMLVVTNIH